MSIQLQDGKGSSSLMEVLKNRGQVDSRVESAFVRAAVEGLAYVWANVGYNMGAASNTEVLDAEMLRTRSYRNHYDGVYDAALATLRLARATGDL